MATVYKAIQESLQRPVMIKIMSANLSTIELIYSLEPADISFLHKCF